MKLIGKAPRGALLLLLALALGGAIAACGSANSSTTTSSSSGTGTTASAAASGGRPNSAQRAALAACLKQHGVTLPARPAGAPPGGAGGAGGAGSAGSAGGAGGGTGAGTTGTGTTRRRGFFGGGGAFATNPKFRAAFQACGAKFGFRGGQGFRGRLTHTTITKYVTCVRQHGYNLPNPNFSGKGPIFPANIQSNAKFQAASRACQSILVPPRTGGGGPGTVTGTNTTAGA